MNKKEYNIAERQVFKILMMIAGMVEDYPCRKFSSKKDLIDLISQELMLSTDKVKKILLEFTYTYNLIRLKFEKGEVYVEILKEENKLDDDLLSRIDAYYELYGAKE